jgi:hypothetical protein
VLKVTVLTYVDVQSQHLPVGTDNTQRWSVMATDLRAQISNSGLPELETATASLRTKVQLHRCDNLESHMQRFIVLIFASGTFLIRTREVLCASRYSDIVACHLFARAPLQLLLQMGKITDSCFRLHPFRSPSATVYYIITKSTLQSK